MNNKFKYEKIRNAVLNDARKSDSLRLPSEREICRRYNVSLTTAKKALLSLSDKNMAVRTVGKGTYLVKPLKKRRLCFILPWRWKYLKEHFESEALRFSASNDGVEIEIKLIEPSFSIGEAVSEDPRTKIVFSSHFAFLSSRNMLCPLNSFSGFEDCQRELNYNFVEWNSWNKKESSCDFLPLFINPVVFAYNRVLASKLKLDHERGPASMEDVIAWAEAAKDFSYRKRKIHSVYFNMNEDGAFNGAPIPYYNIFSNGKPYIGKDKLEFDFSAGEKWMEFFRKIYETGSVLSSPKDYPCPLVKGETLFHMESGSWIIGQMKKFKNDSISFCPLPSLKADSVSPGYFRKLGLAILNEGGSSMDEKKCAWDFIRFLCLDEASQRRLINSETLSCLAINRKVFLEQCSKMEWQPFVKDLILARSSEDNPVQHAINKVVIRFFSEAVTGKTNVSSATSEINKICKIIIDIEKDKNRIFLF